MYNCDGTRHSTHDQASKDVTASPYYIKAAAGDATIRQLGPCISTGLTFGTQYDEPFVLLANLQDYNDSTTHNIVQVGYARCGVPAGYQCPGLMPPDGNMYLIWTPSDHSTGAVTAATWYDAGGPLTLGNRYRMRISRLTSGCAIGQADCWQFCVRNITAGDAYTCNTIDYTWPTSTGGNFAWWGAETNNYGSQMGVTAAGADFTMDYMQYLTTQSGAQWTVRTGIPACELPNGGPTYYHCNITTTVYSSDTLLAWTALH